MVKIYKQPFAHGGDTIAIPDASQPDGKMSSTDGWTLDYQLPKTDPNYKPVGRQEMNGVFKEVTEALGQVQVQGTASWSADGTPYPIRAQVYHNGKQWLALRANSVAPVEGEAWTELVGKQHLQPSMTGSATLNGSIDNVVILTGIVTTLGLEVGDVIRIQYSGYNKLHTVELISDANLIVVNYEHAGNRANGSLRLPDTTATATITRIAKWYNAPLGLGQAWVDTRASRSLGSNYTNTAGRAIVVSVSGWVRDNSGSDAVLAVDGKPIAVAYTGPLSTGAQCSGVAPHGATYRYYATSNSSWVIGEWYELR